MSAPRQITDAEIHAAAVAIQTTLSRAAALATGVSINAAERVLRGVVAPTDATRELARLALEAAAKVKLQ